MIFIFDWGYVSEKKIGPLSTEDAHFELDTDMVWLTKSHTWFRLFFIPTIPTATRYFFVSATDGSRQPVDQHTFDRYRDLAKLNMLVMDDKISDREYRERRSKMNC